MKRNFEKWLSTFCESIADYNYYIDFNTVYNNVEKYKVEINILNSLVGSKNIEEDFDKIVKKNPEVLKCIPTLLAIREKQISILDKDGNSFLYKFDEANYETNQYKVFMRETGLFELLETHLINNLYDYMLGIEVGLNSYARKNRAGYLMENVVEKYIKEAELTKDIEYHKDWYLEDLNVDSSLISNSSLMRVDFVVKTPNCVYCIDTNFYSSGGIKLQETARRYKEISEKMNKEDFKYIWITDGPGWLFARNALKDAFENIEDIYNINDLRNGILKEIFK